MSRRVLRSIMLYLGVASVSVSWQIPGLRGAGLNMLGSFLLAVYGLGDNEK